MIRLAQRRVSSLMMVDDPDMLPGWPVGWTVGSLVGVGGLLGEAGGQKSAESCALGHKLHVGSVRAASDLYAPAWHRAIQGLGLEATDAVTWVSGP